MEFDLFSQAASGRLFLPFSLLRVFAFGFTSCICSEPVNEGYHYLLDVDLRVELRGCGQERAQGMEMELVCKNLDPTLEQSTQKECVRRT